MGIIKNTLTGLLVAVTAAGAVAGEAPAKPDVVPDQTASEVYKKPPQKEELKWLSPRFFTENTSSGKNNTFTQQVRFGESPLNEWLAVRYSNHNNNGDKSDLAVWGFRTPRFNIGDLSNKVVVYGNEGVHKGIGVETRHSLKDIELMVNVESAQDNKRKVGIGADWHADKLLVGAGYDNVNLDGKSTDFLFGRAVYDITPKDKLGVAVQVADKDGEKAFRANGSFLHHSDDWGLRVLAGTTQSDDTKHYTGEVILAGKTTLCDPSSRVWTSRSAEEGGLFSQTLLGKNVFAPYRYMALDRVKEGPVAIVGGSHTTTRGESSYGIKSEVGYKFPVGDGFVGVSAFHNYNHTPSGDDQKAGGSLMVGLGKALKFEARATHSISGASKPTDVYVGLSVDLLKLFEKKGKK
jgi:hypothetical protein